MTLQELIYQWAKYRDIDYYHAAADYDGLLRLFNGDRETTIRYMKIKVSGQKISPKEFLGMLENSAKIELPE
jgi:hypothetical protein